ncbi:MAG: lamin tail domain-containing protein [Flavobacteriales bacterium]|nr:lamin tail domain-containing protein [Flavobacteriales bacterium]
MRSRIIPALSSLLTLVLWSPASAQINEDFEDGDFTAGTEWGGTTGLFSVMDDGGNQRLRSTSPGAANYYLSTPNTLVNDAQWEFFFDLRFATSGANYVDVYLMSSASDLASGVSGYFVRIGGTADRLELFRSDAGTPASLALQSPDAVVNSSTSNPFRVKVTRSAAGLFTLLYDDGNTGSYITAGTVTDATYASATHFGIRIEQSTAASAVNNHFFDDISAQLIPVDNTPPELLSTAIVSATQIDLFFNEAVEQVTAEEENNYGIIPFNSAASVVRDGSDLTLVHLTLAIAMQSGNTYTITVNGVEDLVGNACVNETTDVLYVIPDLALPGDVIINEIMADPSPTVGLPDAEFVEIFNTTANKTFDLAGWSFSDGGTPATLPGSMLGPGEHAIIMDDATAPLFGAFTNVIVVTSFPSLNNDGDPLELKNEVATTIDAVTYALSWYQDALKALGGWTLERIDPTAPCSSSSNWIASNNAAGGTPSQQNSVFAITTDTEAPALQNVQVNDATHIVLIFSETMDATSLTSGGYAIAPSISVGSAFTTGPNSVQLTLSTPLTIGTLYQITVTNVSDCPGNAIGTNNTATFALPEPVEVGDVVINEVMYDPIIGGSDFVELYNRSSKTLSLAGWKLANVTSGVVASPLTITGASFLLLPGEYALITEDGTSTAGIYPQSRTDRFVETDMPSYNNGEGSVVLQAPDGTQLDRFDYNDDVHFTLVNAPEGYSLERVDPDRPTSDNTNWQTAADVAGRATPGFRNSQYSPTASPSGEMTIDPAIFSPDNDGFEDVLTVVYRFGQPGFVGNLSVYDIAGREVRKLMENQLLGTDGAISWDGILDDTSKARMGAYIVLFEVFDLDGNTELFKKTVTVAHKLN